jgi:ComF family protein
VQALKFHGVRALGRAFGLLLAYELERRNVSVDALIPVPLHASRLRERSYNQAAEIARVVAAELDIPLHVHGACRVRATAAQTTLDVADRNLNVAGAFVVEKDYTGRRVALIDDVITTGATVNALAAAVRLAGAAAVSAWAIARTPELASDRRSPDRPRAQLA